MSEQHRLSYPHEDSLELAHQATTIAGMLTPELVDALERVADDAERWNAEHINGSGGPDAIERVRAFKDTLGAFVVEEES